MDVSVQKTLVVDDEKEFFVQMEGNTVWNRLPGFYRGKWCWNSWSIKKI